MRRLIATSLALSALFVAGCGGGEDSGSALDSSLSFLPKDAPFAVAIDTDLDGDQYKAVQALLKKFPFGGRSRTASSSSSSRARTSTSTTT